MRIPTHLDRYPAKMVFRLADQLIDRYASSAVRIFDPFCGSGNILLAANRRGIPVTGLDLNPVAGLLSLVKLYGFNQSNAIVLANQLIEIAQSVKVIFPIQWRTKKYWFTPVTLNKFERLRAACHEIDLQKNGDGLAVLLSLVMSIRLCSKADQRSPKPFISKQSKETRKGRHYDPYRILQNVLQGLSFHYGKPATNTDAKFISGDVTTDLSIPKRIGKHSHVITSPPYINAQDYFRNFKLELYILEDILPFKIDNLRNRFVGTERGDLLFGISQERIEKNYAMLPKLKKLNSQNRRLSAVVHRYLHDMSSAFDIIKDCLEPDAVFILVCGDNLVGGLRIRTWQLLKQMLEERGFKLFDQFMDPIKRRMLAPKRCGHKGIIKEEVVSAFRRH